jgi:methyl-accepting chemotaxis protein
MVTGIQFQDRTRQRLEHVIDTLHVIDQAIEEIKCSTVGSVPDLADEAPDVEWIKKLLERFTMSDMRARFVTQLLDGGGPADLAGGGSRNNALSTSGSIELF